MDSLTSNLVERKQYLDEQLLTARDYLERALPATYQLADQLYKGPDQGTWEQFSQLLEGLEWLTQFVDELSANKEIYPSWPVHGESNSFKDPLDNLVAAVENNDPLLLGDIIHYELAEVLETLKADVNKTIEAEVPGDGLH